MATPRASSAATVVTGAGAALALHPSTVAGLKLPVMSGAVVSWIVMVWVTVLGLLQDRKSVEVRVTTIGQLPLGASVELTVRLASLVQASLMATPRASSAATVVTGAGAALALHPSTVAGLKLPVMSGAVVSWIVMVWVTVLGLLQAS